jgi:hypothetical protein
MTENRLRHKNSDSPVTRGSMPGSRTCQLSPSQGTPISLLKTTKTVITSPMLQQSRPTLNNTIRDCPR